MNPCIQMMHHGSFDNEPASFAKMEAFATEQNLMRKSKSTSGDLFERFPQSTRGKIKDNSEVRSQSLALTVNSKTASC